MASTMSSPLCRLVAKLNEFSDLNSFIPVIINEIPINEIPIIVVMINNQLMQPSIIAMMLEICRIVAIKPICYS